MQWEPGDLDTPGTYSVEAQVSYSDGTQQTFPGDVFKVRGQIG